MPRQETYFPFVGKALRNKTLRFETGIVPRSSLGHPVLRDRLPVADHGKANCDLLPSEWAIVGAMGTSQIVGGLAIKF